MKLFPNPQQMEKRSLTNKIVTIFNKSSSPITIKYPGDAVSIHKIIRPPKKPTRLKINALCKASFDDDGKLQWMFTPMKTQKETGRKDDSSKIRWQLLPWDQVEEVAKVMTFGARKYTPDNWKHVPNARERYFDAAIRHIRAWQRGHKRDAQSGRPHLAHAICCLLFLMFFDKEKK